MSNYARQKNSRTQSSKGLPAVFLKPTFAEHLIERIAKGGNRNLSSLILRISMTYYLSIILKEEKKLLKARNRKLSLILILAMLMTMFAGLGTASAATTTYSCLQAPYITKGADVSANDASLGTILVNWDVLMGGPHSAIISLPGDLEFKNSSTVGSVVVTKPGDQNYSGTISLDYISAKEAKITVPSVGTSVYNDVQAAIRLDNIKVSSSASAGPVNVTFSNLSGLFPQGSVTIGNITGGAAQVTVVETQTITEGSSTAIEFTIQEDSAQGLKAENDTIKFKLPKGFSWTGTPTITNVATGATLTAADFTFSTSSDDRELRVSRLNTSFGRSIFRVKAFVAVDETEADFGDVNVSISGKSTLAPNSVLIGTYSDYGYEVVVDEVAEILSGRAGEDATITFNIKESVKGSLLNGRTIYFTLPDGVEWMVDSNGDLSDFDVTTEDGSLSLTASIVKNKPEMVKATVVNSPSDKGEVEIEAQLKVAANYVGDITLNLSGSAVMEEEIKVAKAVAPLTGSVDTVEVKIGAQSQKAGDITLTETVKEALMSNGAPTLTLTLPAGAAWAKLPTVTVNNGLSIGTVTRATANGTTNAQLIIPIRAQSDEAATITISDVYLTVDRTVPEGALNATVSGAAVNAANITNRGTALSLKVAEVVTPAPGETSGNVEFRIGSNIYYVGGVAKVMDVAPYIKGGRTYVPMRYMGEALGAEVVWDDAARTVTLTKGETTVVFTIGSTSYTVNGEAKTADVAPEITNDRTMLPARFVAEAFSVVVGWDASSQTVLLQK